MVLVDLIFAFGMVVEWDAVIVADHEGCRFICSVKSCSNLACTALELCTVLGYLEGG